MSKEGFTMELGGLQEWYKMMDGMPLQMKAKALQSVNRKAANEIIKKSVTTKHDADTATKVRNERGDPTGVLVGITTDDFHFRFIEYGTKMRKNLGRKKGRKGNRGVMPAEPFWGSMIDEQAPKVVAFANTNFGDLMGKYLGRAVKAVNRAANKK